MRLIGNEQGVVYNHLMNLASKPRCVGSEGEAWAGKYIAEEFSKLGLDVRTEKIRYVKSEAYRRTIALLAIWLNFFLILFSWWMHPIWILSIYFVFALFVSKALPKVELRLAKTEGYNIVATSGKEKIPRLMITAHYDSSAVQRPFIQRHHETLLKMLPLIGLSMLSYVAFLLLRSIAGTLLEDISLLSFGGVMGGFWVYPWLIYCIAYLPLSIFLSAVYIGLKTKECSMGADDNASGIAVMLEIAKAKQDANLRLDFLCFAAEEKGLFGSRQWVNDHLSEIDTKNTYVLNLDCVGRGRIFYLIRGLGIFPKKWSDPLLCNLIKESADELGFLLEEAWRGDSDHAEFARRNLRVAAILRCEPMKRTAAMKLLDWIYGNPVKAQTIPKVEWIHTEDDIWEKVDEEKLRQTVALVLRVMEKLEEKYYDTKKGAE